MSIAAFPILASQTSPQERVGSAKPEALLAERRDVLGETALQPQIVDSFLPSAPGLDETSMRFAQDRREAIRQAGHYTGPSIFDRRDQFDF